MFLNNYSKKKIFLFSLILSFSTLVKGQQYCFRNISVEEGLPQSTAFCMLQDSRGYIWAGTNGGGVSKYDGKNFITYNKNNGLSGNIVRSLLEDKKGNIWIGTDNGITIYNGYSHLTINSEAGLKGSTILKLFEDRQNNIWAATNDGGLNKIQLLENDSVSVSNISVTNGLSSNFIFDIYEDVQNRLWLATLGGINIITIHPDKINVIKLNKDCEIPSDVILTIKEDYQGNICCGTYDKGLFVIDKTFLKKIEKLNSADCKSYYTNDIIWDIKSDKNKNLWLATDKSGVFCKKPSDKFITFNNKNGLLSNQILSILEDREGNIWFGSMGKGLFMYLDKTFVNYYTKDGLPGNKVYSIIQNNKQLLIGTNQGLTTLNLKKGTVNTKSTYNLTNGLADNTINTICVDNENSIWLGTNKGVSIINDSKVKSLNETDELSSNIISCIYIDSENNKWIGTDNGYTLISKNGIFKFNQEQGFINNEVQTIIEDKSKRIWIGTLGGLVRIDGKTYTDFIEEDGLSALSINALAEDNAGNIWIGTFGGGLFMFDIKKDSIPIIHKADNKILSSNNIYSLKFLNDTTILIGTDTGFDELIITNDKRISKVVNFNKNDGFYGIENNINALHVDNKGSAWFGTVNGLTKYTPVNFNNDTLAPQISITDIKLFFEDVDWTKKKIATNEWFNIPEKLKLPHDENHLTFNFSAINFSNPKDVKYSYLLSGNKKKWSPPIKNNQVVFSSLSPGEYNFKVFAINKFGLKGNTAKFNFVINPPIWQTIPFYISVFLAISGLLYLYIRQREKKLRKDKLILEKTVKKRTAEVVKQRDIATAQKKEITDSIHYAERIQRAVLPKEKILKNNFSDYFILFRPRDIVSGDFYWIGENNNHIIVTAADCTGHGVPGAFMSMLGLSFFNKIINELGITQSDIILNKLRENVILALKQNGLAGENKDGMDVSLCSIDITNKKLQFTGANNPLIIIRKSENANDSDYELIELKGDRMPVAIYINMTSFKLNEYDLKSGDSIYMFSDGYQDQFGGPSGRKFMKKRFKQLLLSVQDKPMTEQKEILLKNVEDWKKGNGNGETQEQIDDILVLGIRI
ncbi:MAG: SpoIIE family protein phosphatase [Bacteroidetes bacterium]|nr:SpoIIE family protein phosphatase [Bacteroidota bacterium]